MLPINKKISLINWTDRNTKPKYIVIHYVGGVSTAKNNADYFYKVYRAASAHYFVDETSIWQVVDDLDSAWHCGSENGKYYHTKCRNTNSIGIEMCCKKKSNGTWYFEEKTVNNTVDLVKSLMKKYNIPVENVIRHYDVTHKTCPYPYVKDANAWKNFKAKLTAKSTTTTTTTKKPATTTTTKTYKVVTTVNGYTTSDNAKNKKNAVGKVTAGTYYVFNEAKGMINVTSKKGVAGSWINPADNVVKKATATTKPKTNSIVGKTLYLPKTASHWNVYPTNKAPVVGNECGALNPKAFGGLSYKILANPQTNVVTISTYNFGKVNIYVGSETGAVIK